MMDRTITIPVLGDNFTYLYQSGRDTAFAVDPGESSTILNILGQRGLTLAAVLLTHHHWDHIGGVAELKSRTGCEVIGGDKDRIRGIDRLVSAGEILTIGDANVQVIATPGHTRTAVCYYIEAPDDNADGILWTGDTLFVGGCGRLFECGPQTMWDSLQRLASLPDWTLVYCGHDYTLENYEFALSIEPENKAVARRLQEVRQAQQPGKHTVPSTILQEKQTNPFLRADTPELKAALNMLQARPVDVFAELRRRKDVF